MLRSSLRSSRALAHGSVAARAGRQWQPPRAHAALAVAKRTFADEVKPSILNSTPAVMPGSTTSATATPPPPSTISSSATIPADQVPRTPVPPTGETATPPPPPPPARKRSHLVRNLFYTLVLLATAYGGGVYYSRVNDNFHDFFTEYIPYGEEAVLYFEERDFKKRFPVAGKAKRDGETVTIPSQSGVSWRVSDARVSAHDATNAPKPAAAPAPPPPPPPAPAKKEEAPPAKAMPEFKPPEVDEPSRFPPAASRIDPVASAGEPLMEDLAKVLNDIIAVVNAENANKQFSNTIYKAKADLKQIGAKILEMKAEGAKQVESEVAKSHKQFDEAALALVKRLEGEMQAVEAKWREEFESERQKLEQTFEEKLSLNLQRAKEVYEERLNNQLLEQALAMQRQFVGEVKSRVEAEREARLGKLSDLSESVGDLEKLTVDWNTVLNNNLKTQQLHVAVEAVRASLEKAQTPRPFVKELAALKEIAAGDAVVDAAIASINPTAYQSGIPTASQLIDRFRRVAVEVRKASLLPEEAGVASHASSYVLSKLMFKKQGLAEGDDVESVLTRTETFLEEGNLDYAAREMNGLKGWAKTLSRDWLAEVRKVLEVQQALDVISTEARLQSLRVE